MSVLVHFTLFHKTINATLHPRTASGMIHHSVVSLSCEYTAASLTIAINKSDPHIYNVKKM